MFLAKICSCQTFCHIFSNNKDDGEAIPFRTDTSSLTNKVCAEHNFLVTCSQTKCQKIQMPSLFSNHPAKTKSRTAPTIKNISVSNPALVSSSSSSKVSQPPQLHKSINHFLYNPCTSVVDLVK